MKKSHQIITIGAILLVIAIVGVIVYFSEGSRMRNSHFIRLELNPKVEFMTDADNIVDTVYPVNDEAYEVIVGEEFVGLKIEEAVEKYLSLCMQMGYFDLDGDNNGIQVSVSSSFTQSLENKIYTACNKFFIDNEIMCVIAESDADLALYKEKKEKKVTNIEKLVLIKSILEKSREYTFEELNSKTQSDLIDILETFHENKLNDLIDYNQQFYDNKILSIDKYKTIYDNHIKNITKESQKEFNEKYAKFKKSATYDWELNFQKKMQESMNN